MMSLNQSPFALKNASEHFKDDDEIVKMASKHSTYVISQVSKRLQDDINMLNHLLEMNFDFLHLCPELHVEDK